MKLYDENGHLILDSDSAEQPTNANPGFVVFQLPNPKAEIKMMFGTQSGDQKLYDFYNKYRQNLSPARIASTVMPPRNPNTTSPGAVVPYVPNARIQNLRDAEEGGNRGQAPSNPNGWLIASTVCFVLGMLATTTDIPEDDILSLILVSLSAPLFLQATNRMSEPYKRAFISFAGAYASLIAGSTLILQNGENSNNLLNVVGMESLVFYALFCGVARYAFDAREDWGTVQTVYGLVFISSIIATLLLMVEGYSNKNYLSTAAGIGLGAMTVVVAAVLCGEMGWRQRERERARGENGGLLPAPQLRDPLHAYQTFRGQQPFIPQSGINTGSINGDLPNYANGPSYVPTSSNTARSR